MANNSYSTSDNTPEIFFNATDNLDLALSCALYLNGIGYGGSVVMSGVMSSVTTNATVPDGNYSINVTCYDNVNNLGVNDTTWIFIDSTFPQINIVYPQNMSYSINVSSLNYTIFDINAQTCWYSLNGTTNTTINCGTNATGLTSIEGSNTWKVWANDTLNNVNSSSVTFFKDTIYPSINFTSPTDRGVIQSTRKDIIINVTANDSYLNTIKIYLYNSSKGLINTATSSNPNYIDFTSLSNGLYFFNASANDTVGNTNWTETINVTVNFVEIPSGGGVGGGIGVFENSTVICQYIYDFIAINKGRLNYSVSELEPLVKLINSETYPDVSVSLNVSLYISDFENKCNRSYPRFKKVQDNFTIIDYENNNVHCSKEINSTFTVLNIKFNMDSSIPFFSINMQNLSCNSIDWLRWFFRISGSEGIYYINGLKLYWILIAGILAVSIFLIISLRKGEKYERKGY